TEIHQVLAMEVPEEELLKRLVSRGKMSGRSDDNEEVIGKRIKEYYAKTEAVAIHYNELGKLERIKGIGSIEDIFQSLSKNIEKYLQPA
ncbi:MAG TPA: nucleoside monophosphate kinase, partial [Flavipsychrobacter sp.]|nr:nucleoside monophosphate kinase [Flavipsychrobacter sp.]